MPTTNSTVYNAYGKKKRNSLAPYLDAGNSSSSGNMQLANTQPTGGNTRLYNAYAGAGTQPKAMTKVAQAYSAPATSTDTAYRSATSPTAANSAQYQPGEILRQSAANGNTNNAQPQSALTATPAATAQASAQAQSALTGTPSVAPATTASSTGNTSQQRPTVYDLYGSQNNSGAHNAQRQNALNQAEASYNKLLNYLPEYNELMGMRGLGVSEQALLNAQNDYMQNVADINAQYDEMEQAYRDTLISNINTLSGELSAYLNEVGGDFNSDSYQARKQAYIDSGMYTAEEVAAAEALLTDAEKQQINDPISMGKEPLTVTIYNADNGSMPYKIYIDPENEITGELKQTLDNAALNSLGEVQNGFGVVTPIGLIFYYNGKWYRNEI